MKNIFLALDIEEKAGKLVNHALELARKFDAKVWVVHIAAPNPDFVGFEVGPQYIRDSRADELRAEHRFVQKIAKEYKAQGIESEGLLIQGPTVEMILTEAEKLDSELIITGWHDHGFLYSALFGNTANQLLKKSKIPLLVVPID